MTEAVQKVQTLIGRMSNASPEKIFGDVHDLFLQIQQMESAEVAAFYRSIRMLKNATNDKSVRVLCESLDAAVWSRIADIRRGFWYLITKEIKPNRVDSVIRDFAVFGAC